MSASPNDVRDEIEIERREELLQLAIELGEDARALILARMQQGFEVERKTDASLVTAVDRETEQCLRAKIARDCPTAGIVGEEFDDTAGDGELTWVIDPIDGTAEFVAGLPTFGVIVGLFYKSQPLLGVIDHPELGLRTHAAYGLGAYCDGERLTITDLLDLDGAERVGSPSRAGFAKVSDDTAVFDAVTRAQPNIRVFQSCFAHSAVARGGLDAALEWDTAIWDIAATQVLIEEAGGRFVTVRQRPGPTGRACYSVVFGRTKLVERLCATIAQALGGPPSA